MLRQVRGSLKELTAPQLAGCGSGTKNILNEMKYNTYVSLLSRVSQKNPQNTTGLTDSIITSPIKVGISTIKANFGRNCQNKLNFAARVSLDTAQKISITTAVDRSLLDIQGGRGDA